MLSKILVLCCLLTACAESQVHTFRYPNGCTAGDPSCYVLGHEVRTLDPKEAAQIGAELCPIPGVWAIVPNKKCGRSLIVCAQ